MLVFLTSLFLGPLISITQSSNAIFVYGVKPNLVLAFLVAYALVEKDWLRRAAVLLFAQMALVFGPIVSWQTLYWITIMFLSMALVDYLPWHFAANASLSLLLGILLINLENLRIAVTIMEFTYSIVLLYLMYLGLMYLKSKQGIRYA